MTLEALLSEIEPLQVSGPKDRQITSLQYDSRRVQPGALFFALPGAKADGATFIAQAVAKGAEAFVSEKADFHQGVTGIQVKDARAAMADLAAAYYQHPTLSMKLAGVTGTNGKTTTAFLIKHICNATLHNCGLLGTVRYEIGDRVLPAPRTTPESLDLNDLLWQMRSAGCRYGVMEVSSHALVQSRVRQVEFDAAVFTNLTQDHLDYHQTMDAYFEAKSLLFTGLARQRKKREAVAIVNFDDRYGSLLINRLAGTRVITYGVSVRADFRASNIRSDFTGSSYQLDANNRSFLVRLPLIGLFNVYNSVAAIAAATAMGVDLREAVLSLANAPAVPGRMEAVIAQRNFKVFVDYAHTDDALVNALKTLRELQPARIITVFGCGGNRDRGKRPRMGAAVDQYSDFAIVTSDNPRNEDPLTIIDDIKPGLKRCAYEVIPDRREAIFHAIDLAGPRDIILIAGKGHETTQEFAGETIPFDDVAIARSAIDAKRGDRL